MSTTDEGDAVLSVFAMDVDSLSALWLMRFGREPVDIATALDDQTFSWIAVRLKRLGRLKENPKTMCYAYEHPDAL